MLLIKQEFAVKSKLQSFENILIYVALFLLINAGSQVFGQTFYPIGDSNCDNKVNILDLNILVNRIFRGGAEPGANCPQVLPFSFPYDGNDHVIELPGAISPEQSLVLVSHPGNSAAITLVGQSATGGDIPFGDSAVTVEGGSCVGMRHDSAMQYVARMPLIAGSSGVANGYVMLGVTIPRYEWSKTCNPNIFYYFGGGTTPGLYSFTVRAANSLGNSDCGLEFRVYQTNNNTNVALLHDEFILGGQQSSFQYNVPPPNVLIVNGVKFGFRCWIGPGGGGDVCKVTTSSP